MCNDEKKVKIIYYSDCYFFAGCENMLISFFRSNQIKSNFDITFVYGYSKRYEEGLNDRLTNNIKIIPMKYFSINSLYSVINYLDNIIIQKILRILIRLLMIEYLFFVYDIFRLIIIFKKIKPEILHINNGGYPGSYSCLSAVFAARYCRINKVIFVINNIITPYNSIFRFIDKPIDWFVKNNMTIFITGSKYACDKLRLLWNLADGRAINVPNTITPRTLIESRESLLKRLNIKNDKIILCNIALLEKRKGQKYLVESIGIIKKDFENDYNKFILIIEGEGREYCNLINLSKILGVNKNIIFIQKEKNIFDLMNIIDVFILPSIENEDFPNVILESMSFGKPIIGTDIAGIPEQIKNNVNGFIVKPRDPKELSNAILQMVNNEKMRVEMGKKSLEIYNELFSYEKIMKKYINIYNNLSFNK